MSHCSLFHLLLSCSESAPLALNWLSLADIGHLDSAFCNYASRPDYLHILGRNDVLATVSKIGNVRTILQFGNWVLIRKVTLSYDMNFQRVEITREDMEVILRFSIQLLLENSPIPVRLALWMIMHASSNTDFIHVVSAQSLQSICFNLASDNPSTVNMALHTGKQNHTQSICINVT